MNPGNRLALTLLFLLACIAAPAQQSRFAFTHLTTENGLSSNNILCTAQDKRGFFWLGTPKGVERFDGRWFMPWLDASQPDYCFPGPVEQIFVEDDNRLLLRSGRTVALYDLRSRKLCPLAVDDADASHHYTLAKDGRNNTFLVVERKTILLLNKESLRFEKKGLPFSLPPNFQPSQLFEDTLTHSYWVSGASGLFRYNTTTKQADYPGHSSSPFINKPELQAGVSAFFIDRQRRYWAVAWPHNNAAVFCFNEKTGRFLPAPQFEGISNSYVEFRKFFQQQNGTLWLYGLQTLMAYTEEAHRFGNAKRTDGLNPVDFTYVNAVYEDAETNLWAATDNGLYVLRAQSEGVVNLSLGSKNGDNEITSVAEVDGGYLVGTWGKGLFLLDYNLQFLRADWLRNLRYPHPAYKQVWALHKQKSTGKVWAACQDGKLMCLNLSSKRLRCFQPPVFKGRTVRCIGEDKNGALWFGSQQGRIVKYTLPVGDKKYSDEDFALVADARVPVNNFCTDAANNVWAALGNGGLYKLSAYNNSVSAHVTASPQGLLSNDVTFVKTLNDTTLLVGGPRLQTLNPQTLSFALLTHSGSTFVGIRTATLDGDKSLWLLGETELFKYVPSTGHTSAYEKQEGLLNLKDVGNTAFTASNGRIILAGFNNLLSFHPQDLSSRRLPPPVVVTDFRLFDKFLSIDSLLSQKRIVLQADQNSFAIFFTAISFLQQHNLSYSYKLEGADKDWVTVNRWEPAKYNLLPPGDYVFRARCENNEGVASPQTATLYITVKPHYWQTGWFITLVVLAVAGLACYIYRLRQKQRQALEKLRGKVARDLHDDVGATLTTINILSTVAQGKTEAGSEAATLLRKINENSSRMMEAMDDIIWSINPANDSMEKITYRMREYALTLLEARGIEYDFRVADSVHHLKLAIESRRDVFLIYKEAVNNLVKYSGCTCAEISVDRTDRELVIAVKDNGIGFDESRIKKGNGLTNMQKRAKNLKGDLRLVSQPGKGTTVALKLPLTR